MARGAARWPVAEAPTPSTFTDNVISERWSSRTGSICGESTKGPLSLPTAATRMPTPSDVLRPAVLWS